MIRSPRLIAVSLTLAALVAAGCAKRPAMSQVSAPPPTGAATAPSQATAPTTAPPPAMQAEQKPAAPTAPPPAAAQPPSTARPSPQDYAESRELKDVHFDFDKYDIRKAAADTLDADATWLKSHEDQLVLIEGHCDERGTNEYNLALGERRAKATMNYLVSRGVQASRITVVSYGEERPLCKDHTEGCWAKNRRAHFLVKRR